MDVSFQLIIHFLHATPPQGDLFIHFGYLLSVEDQHCLNREISRY